jgi:NTP pyrophosphatase (non-canonical NTP hydrolase)
MAKWGTDIEDQAFGYWSQETKPQTPTEMVREFVTLSEQKPDPDLYATLIEEEFTEWSIEYSLSNDPIPTRLPTSPESELKELADLLYVIYGYANARGWDVEEAFRRVHQNNTGRIYQPDGTIKRREDGKIMKNKSYPKVDLKDLV